MLSRRDFVSAVAAAATPQLASAQPAAPTPKEPVTEFYEKGNVRIRYQEAGSSFLLLVTPGGGLNSRISNWPTAVVNAPEAFKNDFRERRSTYRGACPARKIPTQALAREPRFTCQGRDMRVVPFIRSSPARLELHAGETV
jgi:hypothetical protein